MARWKLMQPHYLNVLRLNDGTDVEWVHEETNRTTGRVMRKTFKVPMFLDTNNPQDFTEGGDIVVCYEGKGQRTDITFYGKPTPDMEPLDEEAEEITLAAREKWDHPIDSLPANGGMNDKEMAFMNRMMEMMGAAKPVAVASNEVEELKKLLAAQQAQINALITPKVEGRRL